MSADTMKAHEPGECPNALYGKDCNGIATPREDPYLAELYDEHVVDWMCDGVTTGRRMDI
jgi:hypothetical protein